MFAQLDAQSPGGEMQQIQVTKCKLMCRILKEKKSFVRNELKCKSWLSLPFTYVSPTEFHSGFNYKINVARRGHRQKKRFIFASSKNSPAIRSIVSFISRCPFPITTVFFFSSFRGMLPLFAFANVLQYIFYFICLAFSSLRLLYEPAHFMGYVLSIITRKK